MEIEYLFPYRTRTRTCTSVKVLSYFRTSEVLSYESTESTKVLSCIVSFRDGIPSLPGEKLRIFPYGQLLRRDFRIVRGNRCRARGRTQPRA